MKYKANVSSKLAELQRMFAAVKLRSVFAIVIAIETVSSIGLDILLAIDGELIGTFLLNLIHTQRQVCFFSLLWLGCLVVRFLSFAGKRSVCYEQLVLVLGLVFTALNSVDFVLIRVSF